ncbi:MAG: hypothetical protein KA713_10110 [Chryseotalea sp. WA131a]|jgi:hypothetical protein|nr:MAG: hypothetical protein KA713_10010 [Chryseotalea sp. WA131a]UXE68901.1 MAG: hypothetical protein KA713_10110 [Chryseotalea sp. WA131a]
MDDWRTLKNKIYFEDGSLRDIYVFGTDIHDWRKWADLMNEKYKVEFYDAKTELTKDKIDFGTVEECWTQKDREWITATIKLGAVNIRCHFFIDSEIENDIDPRELKSLDDHSNVLKYLRDISVTLDKDVFVTTENTEDDKLISVRENEVILNCA